MQEFWFVLLELFVIETNVGRCLWVHVVGQDGIRPKLAKAIKVQLAGKTRKVAVLEVQWKDSARKFFHVLHDKVISRSGPRCDVWIASIDHMVGFAQKKGKLMLFGTTLEFRRSFGCTGRSRAAPSRTPRGSCFGSHRRCRRCRCRCRRSRCWRGGLVEKTMKAKSWTWKRRGNRQRGSHCRACGRRRCGGRTPNAIRQRTQCVTGKTGLFRIRRSFCVLCQC